MRVFVVGHVAPGCHRAWAINIVKTAGGFARLGHRVRVAARQPESGWTLKSAARAYHEPDLEWVCYPCEPQGDDMVGGSAFLSRYATWCADEAARFVPDMVYARHFTAAAACALAGFPTIMETHGDLTDRAFGADECFDLLRRGVIRALATIATPLAQIYERAGVPANRISIIEDGVDVELFSRPSGFARKSSHALRSDAFNVLYAGHLYDYKGVPTILDAAARLRAVGVGASGRPIAFHLLGGADEDIKRVRSAVRDRGLGAVRVHGCVAHAEVAPWLWSADALLLPPSAHHRSARWTSPVKLGEYLASGRPLICSDIPALRTLVDDRVATFFRADDAGDLLRAIKSVGAISVDEVAARECAGLRLAAAWSYRERARRMIEATYAKG